MFHFHQTYRIHVCLEILGDLHIRMHPTLAWIFKDIIQQRIVSQTGLSLESQTRR